MDSSTFDRGSAAASWVAFAVTFTCVFVGLALDHAAAFVLLLVGILTLGPWTAGFVAARRLETSEPPRVGCALASIGVAIALTATLSIVGIGLFLGAAIAAAMGASAALNLELRAGIHTGWHTSRTHWIDASITLLAWLGSLGSLVAFGDDGTPVAWLLAAAGCGVSVAVGTRRWSTRIARATHEARPARTEGDR